MIENQVVSPIRWTLIALFFLITLVSGFVYSGIMQVIIPIASVLTFFLAMFLHGNERYGLKNIIIFFVITWVVSHFFEAMSIQIGFPFGYYHYDKMPGPRIAEVPILIMLAYFGTGYASWILSNVLLNQYNKKLAGHQIFLVPLIATFIMVIWDLCMDPIASTVGSLWVWRDGGSYFGVPLQNYFGWFLVVYIVFQLFAVYIAKYDNYYPARSAVFASKIFWMEAVAVYAVQALSQLTNPITQTDHMDIYGPMVLVTIFSMVFIVLISWIKIYTDPVRGG
ncbi:MAG: carotenoid biosynthesis protein [Legionella sp.]|nr:carotenoid biosynthesis protein [Legionella sp.]